MFQDNSLDFKLVQRICLLQQALDQAMSSLEELQQRVSTHQLLESQLAQTEEYSNVQEKIIGNLRQKLTDQQLWQIQFLGDLLHQVRTLMEDQQLELERLRVRIQQSQAEVQDYLVRVKNAYQSSSAGELPAAETNAEVMIVRALTVSLSSQLHAAQQHIQQLDRSLTRHQIVFAQLRSRIPSPADETPNLDGEAIDAGDATRSSGHHDQDDGLYDDPVALQAIIRAQRQKIEELNRELAQQFHQQTQLKYRCQELAAERDRGRQREAELQQTNLALEAQIEPDYTPDFQSNLDPDGMIRMWKQIKG